ncbi:hypothetical protein D9M69_547170 [compost metagenome]
MRNHIAEFSNTARNLVNLIFNCVRLLERGNLGDNRYINNTRRFGRLALFAHFFQLSISLGRS